MNGSRHVLNVARSLSGRAWQARLTHDREALAIAERHELPELLGRVLAGRLVPLDQVSAYLNPTLRALMPDPQVLCDMEAGAARIATAVRVGETIGIIGDYDVDGISSTALLSQYLEAAGLQPVIHIPDRLSEGYGPSCAAVDSLRSQKASVLVTLDCGAAAHGPIAHACGLGLDVIVVDHHPAGEELPSALAVINPNRQDDASRLGHLSAAGVTMMLLAAVNRFLRHAGFWTARGGEPDLLAGLDLVALATVCDVMPLIGLNRAFVAQGLKVLATRHRPGLAALADAARLNRRPDVHALGFALGPRINASGRVGSGVAALKLLMTSDRAEAASLAQELERMNRQRQTIELDVVEAAQAQAQTALERDPDAPILVVAGETWHPGVLGLVASRLKERHGRPAIALALDTTTGRASGSGRSIPGIDLGRAIRAAAEAGLLEKGGGHAMAAGLTLATTRLEELREFIGAAITEGGTAIGQRALELDGALTASGATLGLLALIERAGPYGSGNPEPVFAFPAHRVAYADCAGADHVRCTLSSGDGTRIKAVAFRSLGTELGEALVSERAKPLHVAGRLALDDWNGRRAVQLFIDDAAEIV